MNKKYEEIVKYRCQAEGHLYLGIAKSDNKFTDLEKRKIIYCASKAQAMGGNLDVEKMINENITSYLENIMNSSTFEAFDSERHVNEAIKALKKAKELSSWSVQNVYEKIENGIQSVAEIGEYIVKESRFIKDVKLRLKELENI